MSEKKPLSERMKLSWRESPIAGIIFEPGSSVEYRTGDWRGSEKPVIDHNKCIKCFICWIVCPDAAIVRTNDSLSMDYEHCKGCRICVEECPVDAISMVNE